MMTVPGRHKARSRLNRPAGPLPVVVESEASVAKIDAIPASIEALPLALLQLSDLPIFERGPGGDVLNGLMVDYWCYFNDTLMLSGWVVGEQFCELLPRQQGSSGVAVRTFPRPDVETAFPHLHASTCGILVQVDLKGEGFELCKYGVQAPPRFTGDSERMWAEHSSRLGFVLSAFVGADRIPFAFFQNMRPARVSDRRARGHLEQAKGVPGHGGIVVGWALGFSDVRMALVDSYGRTQWLDDAMRWHRPDIVDAFAHEFGNVAFNAGMLQAWHHPLAFGDEIRLIALDGDSCYVLSSLTWDAAPVEPASFARWAFELPTSPDQFFARLDRHDGRIIGSLIEAKLAARAGRAPAITVYGEPPEKPACSIIIPLYGRFDFLMNQLLEMSEDSQLKSDAEIIYVVDDPRIHAELQQQAWLLYEANRVPFKIVSAGDNRGYSGANNLGVSVSRAPVLLLLNSDVIPVETGWLGKMLAALDDDVGIVGARLFYPNGSIQHDGMSFFWHPELRAHVNKHPGMGLEAGLTRPAPTPRTAVTGACLMMRRSLYDEVGGLDETFLIGDFEDSDLCLKVRAAKKAIMCVEDVNLVHLERQSLTGIGQGSFRNYVVRYNAWRHERRWGSVLRTLADGATA